MIQDKSQSQLITAYVHAAKTCIKKRGLTHGV